MKTRTKDIIKKIKKMSQLKGKIIEKDNQLYIVLFVTSKKQNLVYKCLSVKTGEKVLLDPDEIIFQ